MVDYRDTLVVWLRSDSPKAAAEALNVSYATLMGRVKQMRNRGVNVPLHKDFRTRFPLDTLEVAQLNSLIGKHLKAVKGQ